MAFSPAGYIQGQQLEQQRVAADMQRQQIAQLLNSRQNDMNLAAATRQGTGQYLNAAYPSMPAPAPAPMPGTASVPMIHPAPAQAQAFPVGATPTGAPPVLQMSPTNMDGVQPQGVPMPPQQIAPYQTVESASMPPPVAAPTPTLAPPPAMSQGAPSMQQIVENLRSAGIPQDQWMGVIGEIAKTSDMAFQNEYRMMLQRGREEDRKLQRDRLTQGGRALDARIDAANRPKGPTAGNANQFAAQLDKKIAPIDNVMLTGQKLLGALTATGVSTVAPNQIRALLSDYLQRTRMTNMQFSMNSNFGDVYQRPINALDRFITGDITDQNKQEIAALVNSMNDNVFVPARASVVKAYKERAKSQGYDSSVVDSMGNVYGLGTGGSPAAPASAIEYLKSHPDAKGDFKAKYGYLPEGG